VDSSGNVGQHTSLAIDVEDHPRVSYYDATAGALKYAYLGASGWMSETVPGEYDSLALDSTGRPSVSYYEGTSTSPAVLNLHTATRVYLPLVLKEH
jgi:hypothetical protein